MRPVRGLFIGGVRIDVTGEPPQGFALRSDLKVPAKSGGYEWGGSAARAVLALSNVGGIELSFMTKGSGDIMGKAFRIDMRDRNVHLHEYKLEQFPGAMVLPSMGKRDALLIDSAEDDEKNWDAFEQLDVDQFDGLYSDGKLPLAVIHHFKSANRRGIPTLLDGCAGRHHTEDVLRNTRCAIVSSYLCEERGLSPLEMLEFLRSCGCHIGAVTLGGLGLIYYEGGGPMCYLPALIVSEVKNTNGAGDVLHAFVFRSLLLNPGLGWRGHLTHGRAAASHVIQRVKDRLPNESDIAQAMHLPESSARPEWLPDELR